MTRLLADMTGEELAEVLREMAERVQSTMDVNREVIKKLREAAEELESKRKEDNA